MKKPRSDAIFLNLPAHQQSQLAEWLLSGMTYRQAQTRLKAEFLESQEYERTHPKPRPDYSKPLTPEQRAYMVKFVEKKMGLKATPYSPEVIKALPPHWQNMFRNHPDSESTNKKPGDAPEGHDPQMMKNDKL